MIVNEVSAVPEGIEEAKAVYEGSAVLEALEVLVANSAVGAVGTIGDVGDAGAVGTFGTVEAAVEVIGSGVIPFFLNKGKFKGSHKVRRLRR